MTKYAPAKKKPHTLLTEIVLSHIMRGVSMAHSPCKVSAIISTVATATELTSKLLMMLESHT